MGKIKSLILAGIIASFIVCIPSVGWGNGGTVFSDVAVLRSDADPVTNQLHLEVEPNSDDALIYGDRLIFIVDGPIVGQLSTGLSSQMAMKGKTQVDLMGQATANPELWILVGFTIGKPR